MMDSAVQLRIFNHEGHEAREGFYHKFLSFLRVPCAFPPIAFTYHQPSYVINIFSVSLNLTALSEANRRGTL